METNINEEKKMIEKLNQPFPLISYRRSVIQGIFIGGFVFAFLALFQPFGTKGIVEEALKYYSFAGFGLITVFAVVIFGAVFRWFFKDYYNPQNWTVGKEMIHIVMSFFIIGTLNYWFAIWVYDFNSNLITFLSFEGITLLLGGFPVSLLVLLRYNRLLKANLENASGLNSQLHQPNEDYNKQILQLKGELKNDELTIECGQFIYAISADNYVEIFYQVEALKKQMLRMSLKNVEEQTQQFKPLAKCHRKYLVNLDHVKNFEGNAQGLKLFLDGIDETIPVSRSYVNTIKKHLG